MTKADDSSLHPGELRAVQLAARRALDRASGWGVHPTPIADILAAANLKVAPAGAFDPRRIMEFLVGKAESAAIALKSAISKVFGIYDATGSEIHIDHDVAESKQNFLKLHEAGHHELPAHRKLFRIFQDCEKSLDPEISDLFEREANNFARFVLFQGDGYRDMAADHKLEIKTPMKLAGKFGASIYASCREFARTHHRACVVYVLEPITFCSENGARAQVRRIEASASFLMRFGRPNEDVITLKHLLGRVLPVGRRMTKPTTVSMTDLNGQAHECIAEAFSTTFNVLILVYPKKALTTTTVFLPG
ncbi:ImmA/IrrE family metallo-endopeptidase [Bradyrhizobium yuanmingense]|uniref:ImmA/IrrE family metallo-endopeptidase n=1 Tax=Bradyrhizobium yuanmingense TaxID=108015 RepID=UPI0023BA1C6C|nr:ImmA/IrrE family metallo-endopeptidase [Bradyrhizobium yuanmingense]MDF0523315.1 ImmA/IrrE family metallo-endopeptidase [Bradyrhizobium yuanmingense]